MLGNSVVITLLAFLALIAAYVVYGRYLARHLFKLDPRRPTPAHVQEDGVDFLPTRVPVLFGHHFASIAGLGPILGPAIAVIWGWLPAVLWVVIGSIFIGAVHDLGALTVSLRYEGRSIGDVTQELIGPRARFLFLLIIFFLMSLAMGVFVLVISQLFVSYYPNAIVPSMGLMIVAMVLGVSVYKLRMPLGPLSLVGIALLFLLIHLGVQYPLPTYAWTLDRSTRESFEAARRQDQLRAPYGSAAAVDFFSEQGDKTTAENLRAAASDTTKRWSYVLLGYAFLASVLPVWLLLQPRDYLNSYQLYAGLILLLVGMFALHPTIEAPAVADTAATGAPPMFPFLFITIACGAISGFHSLVSSGTTVRQLNNESDALPIGFGAMLTEGALAILVIMACVAGLGHGAWSAGGTYTSWTNLDGRLSTQLAAVVEGGGRFLGALGINTGYAQAFIAVAIVAFALTTLDSATRLLRYNVEEIFKSVGLGVLANRYVASLIAVAGIGFFAMLRVYDVPTGVYKPAGLLLWQMFGTTNQLLAGLTLLTVSLFLFKLARPVWYTLVPMFAMLGISLYTMLLHLSELLGAEVRNWPLIVVNGVVMAMTAWMVVEAVVSFARGREGLDFGEPELPVDEHELDEIVTATHLG